MVSGPIESNKARRLTGKAPDSSRFIPAVTEKFEIPLDLEGFYHLVYRQVARQN